LKRRLKNLPSLSRAPLSQGLATLFSCLSPNSLGSLFQLPTLLGFSLQSFSPPQGSVDPFEPTSPLLHFLKKPLGLLPVLQWLPPPRKAVPRCLLPECLVRVGASALLSFSTSRASLSVEP
jgi:hypothetical protein